MKEKDFDTQLKGMLDRVEEPYDASSWAVLAQRLDAPFAEEQPAAVDPVDKAVYHKLQHIEAPYQPAHWNLLANRLVNLRRLRMRLWISKAAEAAIFLLLLTNLRGYLDTGSNTPPAPPKPKFNGPVAAVQDAPRSGHVASRMAPADPSTNQNFSGNGELAALTANPFAVAELPAAVANSFTSEAGTPSPAGLISEKLFNGAVGPLALLSAAILPFDWMKSQPAIPADAKLAMAKPHRQRFYFASYVGNDHNNIFVDGQSRQTQGFNTGFAVGYRQGKWGIEAGMAYAQKQYDPKKQVEIYAGNVSNGYIGSYLANVDADLISLPVKVTRRLGKVGRTSVHAVAGVTTNIAAQKAYRYKTVQFPGSAPSSQGPNGVTAQPHLRQAGRGALESGGKLANNVYASADVGLRIEQPVGRRWTVFVEPTYRQSLSSNGFGPRPARINTFSLQAGVMAGL